MTIKVEPGLVVPDLRHEDAAAERALDSARLAQENQSRLIKVPNLLQGGEDGTVIETGVTRELANVVPSLPGRHQRTSS